MKPTITIPSNEIEHIDDIMYAIEWLSGVESSFRVWLAVMTVAFKDAVFVSDNVVLRTAWTGGY